MKNNLFGFIFKARKRATVGLALGLSVGSALNPAQAQSSGSSAIPPFLSAAEAARKLPPTLTPDRFSDAGVARAYRIARSIPAVLAQQPCYCWCNRGGHRSLLDCYIDEHASHCDMCMKEAVLADRLNRAGKNPAVIRDAIIRGEWRNVP